MDAAYADVYAPWRAATATPAPTAALPAATTVTDTAPALTAADDTLYIPTRDRLIACRLP